jgi:hypothetical protein
MDDYMAEDLMRWRRQSPYPMDEDWVFASPTMEGKQPYWPDNLMKRYIKPVARKAARFNGSHERITVAPDEHRSSGRQSRSAGDCIQSRGRFDDRPRQRCPPNAAARRADSSA